MVVCLLGKWACCLQVAPGTVIMGQGSQGEGSEDQPYARGNGVWTQSSAPEALLHMPPTLENTLPLGGDLGVLGLYTDRPQP